MRREGVTAPFQEVMPNGNVYWFDAQGVLFKKVYPGGEIEWCDEQEQPHREDGPALEWPDGSRAWCRHGKYHREDGPALETPESKEWYRNEKRHRNDGPAVEYADGRQEWWRNGRR